MNLTGCELDVARVAWPGLSDAECVKVLVEQALSDLALEPPIDPGIVASYRGIARIETIELPWAGSLSAENGEVVARVRASDPHRRRRFTAFHEIEHTYLPGFTHDQYRCDPTPTPRTKNRIEALADLGASEFLLPRTWFSPELEGRDLGFDLVEELCDMFDASLTATAARAVHLSKRPAALLNLEVGTKPSAPAAQPVLRVRWCATPGGWPYFPTHKSVAAGDIFARALKGELIDETTTLDTVCSEPIPDVHVSARAYPYNGPEGIRERVLAILTRPSAVP